MADKERQEVLYDLYDNGEYAGRYPIAVLALILGIRHNSTISRYGLSGREYHKRYIFERVDEEPISKDLAEDWDRTRISILKAGR